MTTSGGCPRCSAPVSDTDLACRGCGASFVADPAAVAASMQSQASYAQPSFAPSNPYSPPTGLSANPYAPPAAYAPSYAPGYQPLHPPRHSSDADLALYMAIGGIFCFGFAFGFGAIRYGLRARSQIAANPGMTGGTKAMVAIVLGALDVVGWVAFMLRRARHH